jgi:hypothetical protein
MSERAKEGWEFHDRMKELRRHREFMKNLMNWYDVGARVCYKQDDSIVTVNELIGPTSNPYPGEVLDILEFWDQDSAKDFVKWIELTIRFHGDVR